MMVASKLLGLFSGSRQPAKSRACVPPDTRVYAIGDVHGRLDLLIAMLDRIDVDDAGRPPADTSIVLLGDLVDRGPHSAQVIDHVIERDWHGRSVKVLQGNHEEVMLLALSGDLEAMRFWTRIGGGETMASYGVPAELIERGNAQQLFDDFVARIPRSHCALLYRTVDHVTIGDYAFVHAGIRPGIPLDKQKVNDLRWIRGEFLDHEGDLGAVVVHGHTITETVEEYDNRIGIDTGAYATGRLTVLGLEGQERWYLSSGE
ncbi:MAG: metallophosphoesterase family protein [Sphingomonas sp.]